MNDWIQKILEYIQEKLQLILQLFLDIWNSFSDAFKSFSDFLLFLKAAFLKVVTKFSEQPELMLKYGLSFLLCIVVAGFVVFIIFFVLKSILKFIFSLRRKKQDDKDFYNSKEYRDSLPFIQEYIKHVEEKKRNRFWRRWWRRFRGR